MAALSQEFIITKHGEHTPCKLMYLDDEMVRFEEGLSGKAVFAAKYAEHEKHLQFFGIRVPLDPESSETLRSLAGKSITPEKSGFGEAFYRYYFPKISKGHPERYSWKLLS